MYQSYREKLLSVSKLFLTIKFLITMKSLQLTQMENLQGGKFIGTETEYGECQPIAGGHGIREVTRTFRVFWIGISKTTTYENCAY